MMDIQRFEAEQSILARKLSPNLFKFNDFHTGDPYLALAARTNRGNVYTLKIMLKKFPQEVPKVFLTRMLFDHRNQPLNEASAAMHVLRSENHCTRICHYGALAWTPNVTLYKIYIKCRLWLEMYELHLQTGNNIDYYLNHQS